MKADDVGGGTALQTGESFYFSFVLRFAEFIVSLADVSSLSLAWVSSELKIGMLQGCFVPGRILRKTDSFQSCGLG